MKYEKIDKNLAYKRIYNSLKKEYPQEDEEFYKLITAQKVEKTTRFWLKEYLSDKIQEIYGCNYILGDKKAAKLIDNLPKELFPNVEEWLGGDPISEIDYGGMSIKRIMEQHKESLGRIYDFLTCLEIMNNYIADGCRCKYICYVPFVHEKQ